MIRPMLLTVLIASGVALAEPPAGSHPTATPPKTDQPKPVPSKKVVPTGKRPAPAKEATLKVGSKAPAITADKWVKGAEIKSFESGKVYVVEFWATWCPPCVKSIPHLTELQKTHKEVTVIGMASSEHKSADGPDKRLEKVEKFVAAKGDEMNYTVAYDANRAMSKDWMQAAGQSGIPTAFVVGGDGKIVWIGNPLSTEKMTDAVEKALKDAKPDSATADPKPARKG